MVVRFPIARLQLSHTELVRFEIHEAYEAEQRERLVALRHRARALQPCCAPRLQVSTPDCVKRPPGSANQFNLCIHSEEEKKKTVFLEIAVMEKNAESVPESIPYHYESIVQAASTFHRIGSNSLLLWLRD